MTAIGRIDHVDSRGNVNVTMFYDGKWQKGSWRLENKNEMPYNHPEFGLFSFVEQDQFCKWVDPKTQDDLIQELIDERDAIGAEM